MHQSPLHRPRRWARRRTRGRVATAVTACAATVLLAGGLTAAALAATSAAQASNAALSVNWYESAPYYSTLDSSGPDLGQVMSATGQKAFDMAFILANNGSCSPSWDGTDPVSSDTQVSGVINQVRAGGGAGELPAVGPGTPDCEPERGHDVGADRQLVRVGAVLQRA